MIVIAGGGLAGQRCCERLRRKGYDGPITIVCAEPHAPYDRPPLSKQFLAGKATAAPRLRPDSWYGDNDVELRLGEAATELRADRHELRLSSGAVLRYERLLVATGAVPRTLPGAGRFSNVHALRTLADAARLRDRVQAGVRLIVVGAGFIGQEVAATARQLGAEVTLVEAMAAPLVHVLGERVGGWFAQLHRDEGVDVRLNAGFAGFEGTGRATRVALADDSSVDCDEVVVGVGVSPDTGWLAGTPIGPNGTPAIAADHAGRTVLPDVFAAGDCAGGQHWEAAGAQGAAAALAMLGEHPPIPSRASFWSDLYGTRVNWLGDARRADSVELDGDPEERDFAAIYRYRGRVVAGLLVGRPQQLPQLRKELP